MIRFALLLGFLTFWLAGCGGNGREAAPTTTTVPPTATAVPTMTDEAETAVPAPPRGKVVVADIGPALATLPDGWTRVEPGGDTRCAHDTPFAYWVKPGTVNKLLIYFEGGGGCWDAQTCRPGSSFYDPDVGSDESPAFRSGIFDLDHPGNPFADYFAVYIPSCNGDVYWGNNVAAYPQDDGGKLTIFHRGFVNGAAALDWAYAQVPEPESVFITGCSAGSVGSRVHAPYILEQYPQARVTQLGDSLAFVFGRPVRLVEYNSAHTFPDWIPELASLASDDGFLMADYDAIIANHYPQATFAQYNTETDAVQVRFYTAVSGMDADEFRVDLAAHLTAVHAAAPNFRSFTPAGELHCILPRPQFYNQETDGVRLVDWVQALADGRPVENIQCPSCAVSWPE